VKAEGPRRIAFRKTRFAVAQSESYLDFRRTRPGPKSISLSVLKSNRFDFDLVKSFAAKPR